MSSKPSGRDSGRNEEHSFDKEEKPFLTTEYFSQWSLGTETRQYDGDGNQTAVGGVVQGR